jgi:16S rRNA pseudouridine516 synthase
MLYKPAGCVSATKDRLSDTVLDILKEENTDGLFPVGRLDKDTEGLLLITNDGKLAHELLSPAKHVDKKYFVTLDKAIDDESISKIEDGIDIDDDKPCLPCEIEKIEENKVFITIREGRFHQVKRMFAAVGFTVTYLKRISMGNVTLDESLNPGEYRRLTDEEVQNLKNK